MTEGRLYPFKYVKPRLAVAVLAVLMVGWPVFILHPDYFDNSPRYHDRASWIDVTIRQLPNLGRSIVSFGFKVYFSYILWTLYLPCVRRETMKIFSDNQIHGFNLWGRDDALSVDEVSSVSFRNGAAIVRGAGKRLRIPLSLLNINSDEQRELRSALKRSA